MTAVMTEKTPYSSEKYICKVLLEANTIFCPDNAKIASEKPWRHIDLNIRLWVSRVLLWVVRVLLWVLRPPDASPSTRLELSARGIFRSHTLAGLDVAASITHTAMPRLPSSDSSNPCRHKFHPTRKTSHRLPNSRPCILPNLPHPYKAQGSSSPHTVAFKIVILAIHAISDHCIGSSWCCIDQLGWTRRRPQWYRQ
ncbi:hypothetical protein Ae201684P_019998 [Aphanomyces euteiches]|uniref:Uncharacterized protein n=1 Tax=Aphanomyces euteiches TaxID=100861 RepID=A0A6G0WDU7_9STRA|nr:hypothetical protein Ae201684_016065 [Aphanomyces euteiches]KAH9078935.1 hypothetical protein Ae201684P_019998 [Aphanomyces euteiches]